jgi:hypothetical protein
MLPGLVGRGGYDYNAIQVVFDVHEVERGKRADMLGLITRLIDVVEAERRSRENEG